MAKKYVVSLRDDERAELRELVRKGTHPARKLTRAHILLQADTGATDASIAEALHVGKRTVERVRQRFVEGNLEQALSERPRPGGKSKLDAKGEALLIATTCSPAPQGRAHWTLQLLADELVALEAVDTISYETVRRTLKKTSSSPGRSKSG
jgi:transposase